MQNGKGAVYATGVTDGRDLNLKNHNSAGITFLSRGADVPAYGTSILTLSDTWRVSISAGPPMVKT
jgi:hypothetical protein